jgi:ribonuclease D
MLSTTGIILVMELHDALVICRWIAENFTVIAIDIEGVNLGREGEITLVQISTDEKTVFCFDVLALGDVVFSDPYLGQIFRSNAICKLCYDCRTDADILKAKHRVNLQYVYDLQVLYTFLFQAERDRYLKGLHHALQMPGILKSKNAKRILKYKREFKETLKTRGSEIFLQRPLSRNVLSYCVSDVIYLYKMFYTWGPSVNFDSVVQASMYRLNKFCNRCGDIPPKKMSTIDFTQKLIATP